MTYDDYTKAFKPFSTDETFDADEAYSYGYEVWQEAFQQGSQVGYYDGFDDGREAGEGGAWCPTEERHHGSLTDEAPFLADLDALSGLARLIAAAVRDRSSPIHDESARTLTLLSKWADEHRPSYGDLYLRSAAR